MDVCATCRNVFSVMEFEIAVICPTCGSWILLDGNEDGVCVLCDLEIFDDEETER